MSRLVAALLMTVLPLGLHAQDDDPLASPECQAARAELEQALSDADMGLASAGDRLARSRAQARNACLGRGDGARERSGAPEPVQRIAPPITNGRAQLPRLEAAPPPVANPRPTIITTCDASGCWDTEGRRLNNAGPALMGPRGLCSGTGNAINCP